MSIMTMIKNTKFAADSKTDNKELKNAMAKLEDSAETIKFLEANIAKLEAQVEQLKETLNLKEQEAVKTKMEARQTKLENLVGTSRASALFNATNSLEDSAFDAIVSALAVDVASEGESFKEVGANVEAEVNIKNTTAHFKDYIKKGNKR